MHQQFDKVAKRKDVKSNIQRNSEINIFVTLYLLHKSSSVHKNKNSTQAVSEDFRKITKAAFQRCLQSGPDKPRCPRQEIWSGHHQARTSQTAKQ